MNLGIGGSWIRQLMLKATQWTTFMSCSVTSEPEIACSLQNQSLNLFVWNACDCATFSFQVTHSENYPRYASHEIKHCLYGCHDGQFYFSCLLWEEDQFWPTLAWSLGWLSLFEGSIHKSTKRMFKKRSKKQRSQLQGQTSTIHWAIDDTTHVGLFISAMPALHPGRR